jgi:hypothetical protein
VANPAAAPSRPGVDAAVRACCHIAAAFPIVIVAIRSRATGWRPASDAAVLAVRAWDVLTAHPTLLGAPTHAVAGAQTFAPGPALSWLVAIPVRLDPNGGLLWGSVLVAVAATSIAVEAGRAAWPSAGSVVVAAAVVILLFSQTDTAFFPVWTPWLGALWLIAALACAWTVASGNWWWWPVSVCASSVAAQAHVVFAPTAIVICVLAPLAALVLRRTTARVQARWRPFALGAGLGFVLWLPTVIDQLAHRPGNVTLIWEASKAPGGTIGMSFSLRALGAAASPIPSWMHRLPTGGGPAFLSIYATVTSAAAWQGVVVLIALLVVAAMAWRTGKNVLAAASLISLAAATATCLTVAGVPRSDAVELAYVTVIYWPIGVATWAVFVVALVAVVRSLGVRAGSGLRSGQLDKVRRFTVASLVTALVCASVLLGIWDATEVPNGLTIAGGPSTAAVVNRATDAVLRIAPQGPFELRLDEVGTTESAATYPALAYALVSRGANVRLPAASAMGIDGRYQSTTGLPIVTVRVLPNGRPLVTAQPGRS